MAETFMLAGRTVDRIGYGAMRLRARPPDFRDAIAVLRRAVELAGRGIAYVPFFPLLGVPPSAEASIAPEARAADRAS